MCCTLATDSQLARQLVAFTGHAFDLLKEAPMRMEIWVLSPQQHILLAGMHHTVTDGWSAALVQQELTLAYTAVVAKSSPAWAPLPVQLVDYAAWQREHLAGEVMDAQIEWWIESLAGAPPLLEMPWDKARPNMVSSSGTAVLWEVEPAVAAALRKLAADERTTLFVVLLSAIYVFLSRYSGQEDIVVGTPYAGRSREEVQRLAACLVNTIALRGNVSGEPTFKQLLKRAVNTTMAAFDHADAPFPKIVNALKLDRSAAFNPIYQVRQTVHMQ
jgi:Condensation domain